MSTIANFYTILERSLILGTIQIDVKNWALSGTLSPPFPTYPLRTFSNCSATRGVHGIWPIDLASLHDVSF